ncbi:hypothetical protein SAMN05421771_1502 [Granulicella pectinivorans]|uniref:YCII-related domain-containing protein n=1 Tax=Granulicella pectinivorans TaxID=474950 RepID=A0A1I6LYP3_9BACT|nr:hypothetical protein [Granulicella pectinivorans]SFS08566.1 hypothetical protein SAMN05421771_1502 [Granulicella pectinivorans]
MPEYLLLMHNDIPQRGEEGNANAWGDYLGGLQAADILEGGSAIGTGICVRKQGVAPPIAAHLSGYLRIQAEDLDEARTYLVGNPVYEAGGTVEIRELPRTD